VASRFAPAVKLDRIRALEARLELVDGDIEVARERAAAIARCDGHRRRSGAEGTRARCRGDLRPAVLVQEASIIAGMRMLLDHAGKRVVTIVCGSNVDADAYRRWVGAAPVPGS
jgi:hypothetical protein